MDTRLFKMIIEVSRTGSVSRAAELLCLSQSAVSHQLKEIETHFGVQIFIRQKKQMVLTHEGTLLIEAGEKVLHEIDTLKKQLIYRKDGNVGEIRVSTQCYTAYHWLSGFITEFKSPYPHVDIKVCAEATYDSVQSLINNKIDVGIIDGKVISKLEYYPLFSDEFVAVVPMEHEWATKSFVIPRNFYGKNYIMYNVPSESSSIYRMLFRDGSPGKVHKIVLTEAILQMVKAGIGVAALPRWIVRPYAENGELAMVRITKAGLKRPWYAATLRDKAQPPYVSEFVKRLAKHLKKIDSRRSIW